MNPYLKELIARVAKGDFSQYRGSSGRLNEAKLTRECARYLAERSAVGHIYTAKESHAELRKLRADLGLPSIPLDCSWAGSSAKRYDLAWADEESAESPSHLLQIKLFANTGKGEAQGLLFALSDLLFAAIDREPDCREVATLVVIENGGKNDLWKRVAERNGRRFCLHLNPAGSEDGGNAKGDGKGLFREGPGNLGWITPSYRTQYQQLLSGGTNGKFVGAFKRPGCLQVSGCISFLQGPSLSVYLFYSRQRPVFSPDGVATGSIGKRNVWLP